MDRLAGADLEVGPAQFGLEGFVVSPGPAAQHVQTGGPGDVGGWQRAVPADVKVTTAGRPDAVGG
ncbi:hypothetical protein ACGFOU_19585 [Streptomyces sp. NPDC048595]|uniref:hypothetical protein n=1 Tax=Streptomyces sp. NPDC048595 TaxID=3365576 RepID=UPI0037176B5B